jgi:hypothetical protein
VGKLTHTPDADEMAVVGRIEPITYRLSNGRKRRRAIIRGLHQPRPRKPDDSSARGTHSMPRTEAAYICKKTANVDDALGIAEQVEL